MSENSALLEKREKLKRQIAAGEYKSLAHIILDGTGRFIQRLTRNPVPISVWYSAVVVELVIVLIGASTSLLLGEVYSLDLILFGIWGIGLGISAMILVRVTSNMVFATSNETLIDAIESVKDLDDQQNWLAAAFDVRKHLVFSLIIGPLIGFPILVIWATSKGISIGFGQIIIALATEFQIGMAISHLAFTGFTSITPLSQHQLELYTADPSGSEVIHYLSDLFSNIAYLGAIYLAIVTFGVVVFEVPLIPATFYLVLLSWGPLIVFFASHQYTLSRIITRAKWRTLNEIQAKIESLQAQENIPTKETLEHLGKLMDYHDRIKATRNSTLDLRAGLNFLNSLLLPLIAFVLGNLDKVLEFLK